MDLGKQVAAAKNTSGLSLSERVRFSCRLANQLEKAGEYDAAVEALTEFWPDRVGWPNLDGLDDLTKAEMLLRAGALSGWMGSARQAQGTQEVAKNLLTTSIDLFGRLNHSDQAAEAYSYLALCYWREGAFGEARVNLTEALGYLRNEDTDLKAVVLIRAGVVEVAAGRPNDALRLYNEAAPLVNISEDHALKGSLHISLGAVLNSLATTENREDYLDRALIEYTAASFHFEQAGHTRLYASVENNLGFIFLTLGKFPEAHEHIDKARYLFMTLGDQGHVAQVDDTRARALLAEGKVREAERYARAAVKTLDRGDECSLLVEALTTHGIALARMGKHGPARSQLTRASEVAETCGDLEGSGRAKLSVIEELTGQTPATELAAIYESAAELLKRSQDPSATKRLITGARAVIKVLGKTADALKIDQAGSWEGFSLKAEITRIEKEIIGRALREAGGSVSAASHLLGFKHHQSLIASLNKRHKDLLPARSAVRKRRQHIFGDSQRRKRRMVKPAPVRPTPQPAILQVETNESVVATVRDMARNLNWRVDVCRDGDTALRKLTDNAHYDLLLVDNDLPGLSGLELVKRAKQITQRRRTPIIVLGAGDCENQAWAAGVTAFLKKPEELNAVTSTILRLVKPSLRIIKSRQTS